MVHVDEMLCEELKNVCHELKQKLKKKKKKTIGLLSQNEKKQQ